MLEKIVVPLEDRTNNINTNRRSVKHCSDKNVTRLRMKSSKEL